MDKSYKLVYSIRKVFGANLVALFLSLALCLFAALTGNTQTYHAGEFLVVFHLMVVIFTLVILRGLPKPD